MLVRRGRLSSHRSMHRAVCSGPALRSAIALVTLAGVVAAPEVARAIDCASAQDCAAICEYEGHEYCEGFRCVAGECEYDPLAGGGNAELVSGDIGGDAPASDPPAVPASLESGPPSFPSIDFDGLMSHVDAAPPAGPLETPEAVIAYSEATGETLADTYDDVEMCFPDLSEGGEQSAAGIDEASVSLVPKPGSPDPVATAPDGLTKVHDDPVDPASGEFSDTRVDMAIEGLGLSYRLERRYRSRLAYNGPLGWGWDHNYNQRLVRTRSNGCTEGMTFLTGHGTVVFFVGVDDFVPARGEPLDLRYVYEDGSVTGYVLSDKTGLVRTFDIDGLLRTMSDASGNTMWFAWEDSPRADLHRLREVVDTVGRRISYDYDANGFLDAVHEGDAWRVEYTVVVPRILPILPAAEVHGELHDAISPSGVVEHYEYTTEDLSQVGTYAGWETTSELCRARCGHSEIDACPAPGAETSCWSTARAEAAACPARARDYCQLGCGSAAVSALAGEVPTFDACMLGCAGTCWVDSTVGDVGALCDESNAELAEVEAACLDSEFVEAVEACDQVSDMEDECAANATEIAWFDEYCTWFYDDSPQECDAWEEFREFCEGGLAEWDDECVELEEMQLACDVLDAPEVCATHSEDNCSDVIYGCETQCSNVHAATLCIDACVGAIDCPAAGDNAALEGYVLVCQDGCYDGCRESLAAAVGLTSGDAYARYEFGSEGQLNHNLARIRDGNGTVWLENVYETDFSNYAFDRVISQRFGDATFSYQYYEMTNMVASLRATSSEEILCPVEHVRCNGQMAPQGSENEAWVLVSPRTYVTYVPPVAANSALWTTRGTLPDSAVWLEVTPTGTDYVKGGYVAIAPAVTLPATGIDIVTKAGTATIKPSGTKYIISGVVTDLEGPVSIVRTASGRIAFNGKVMGAVALGGSGACASQVLVQTTASGHAMSPASACSGILQVEGLGRRAGGGAFGAHGTVTVSASGGQMRPIDVSYGQAPWGGDMPVMDRMCPGLPVPGGPAPMPPSPPCTPMTAPFEGEFEDYPRPCDDGTVPQMPVPDAPDGTLDPACWFEPYPQPMPSPPPVPPTPSADPVECDMDFGEPIAVPEYITLRHAVTVVRDGDSADPRWAFYSDENGAITKGVNLQTGRSWQIDYDAEGRAKGYRSAFGDTTCTGYDAAWNPIVEVHRPKRGLGASAARIVTKTSYGVNSGVTSVRQEGHGVWGLWLMEAESHDAPEVKHATLYEATLDADGLPIEERRWASAGGPALVTEIVRDAEGRVTDTFAPEGLHTHYDYEQVELLSGVTRDPDGADPIVTSIGRDAEGRVTRISGNSESAQTFAYRPDGRVDRSSLQLSPELDAVNVKYDYDDAGNLLTAQEGDQLTSYAYLPNGRMAQAAVRWLPTGEVHVTCYNYNARGLLTGVASPAGRHTRYLYDADGELQHVLASGTDAAGTWDDACGTNGADARELWVYESERGPSGELLKSRDIAAAGPGSYPWSVYAYDGFGRLVETTLESSWGAAGSGTRYRQHYDLLGRVDGSAVMRPGSPAADPGAALPAAGDMNVASRALVARDDLGRPIEIRQPWYQDRNGQRLPLGADQVTRVVYDDLNRLATTTLPTGAVTTVRRDVLGRPDRVVQPSGQTTTYAYRAGGLTTDMTEWFGTSHGVLAATTSTATRYAFGAPKEIVDSGNVRMLVHAVDRYGRTITHQTPTEHKMYEYGDFGRMWATREVDSAGALHLVTTHGFDADGLPDYLAVQPGDIEYETQYDMLGRVLSHCPEQGWDCTEYAYLDGARRPRTVTDPANTTTLYYDIFGAVTVTLATKLDGSAGQEMNQYYRDALGLTQAIASNGDRDTVTLDFERDSFGNVVRETSSLFPDEPIQTWHNGIGAPIVYAIDGLLVGQNYDASGRTTSASYAGQNAATFAYTGQLASQTTFGNGLVEGYTRNALGQLAGITTGANGARRRLTMGYDGQRNLFRVDRAIDNAAARASAFRFDPRSRLEAENHGVDPAGNLFAVTPQLRAFTLDAAANIESIAVGGAVGGAAAAALTYDENFRLQTVAGAAIGSDPVGSTTSIPGVANYRYDAREYLAQATQASRSPMRFLYDAFGRVSAWESDVREWLTVAPFAVGATADVFQLENGHVFGLDPAAAGSLRARLFDERGTLLASSTLGSGAGVGCFGTDCFALRVDSGVRELVRYRDTGASTLTTTRTTVLAAPAVLLDASIDGDRIAVVYRSSTLTTANVCLRLFKVTSSALTQDGLDMCLGSLTAYPAPANATTQTMSIAYAQVGSEQRAALLDAQGGVTLFTLAPAAGTATVLASFARAGAAKLKDLALNPSGALLVTSTTGSKLYTAPYAATNYTQKSHTRRVSALVDSLHRASGGFFGYSGLLLVNMERKRTALQYADGRVLRIANDAHETVFVPGQGGAPVGIVHDGVMAYVHAGPDGRPELLTNGAGATLERYARTAYGLVTTTNAQNRTVKYSAHGNRLLMDGVYFPELGLHRLGARWMNPAWGRFLSKDPAGFIDGPNQFAYVGGQPTMFSDPSGLAKLWGGEPTPKQVSKGLREVIPGWNKRADLRLFSGSGATGVTFDGDDIVNDFRPTADDFRNLAYGRYGAYRNPLTGRGGGLIGGADLDPYIDRFLSLGNRKQYIAEAARESRIPSDVLTAVLVTEQLDQSAAEDWCDYHAAVVFGKDTSIGLGQIKVSTAIKNNLAGLGDARDADAVAQILYADEETNIHAAAQYLRQVADLGASIATARKNFGARMLPGYKDSSLWDPEAASLGADGAAWSRGMATMVMVNYTKSAWVSNAAWSQYEYVYTRLQRRK